MFIVQADNAGLLSRFHRPIFFFANLVRSLISAIGFAFGIVAYNRLYHESMLNHSKTFFISTLSVVSISVTIAKYIERFKILHPS